MRFAILAYSCVYPINAASREEALNRAVSFSRERKVMTGLNYSPDGKRAFNVAYVSAKGEVQYLAGWEDLRVPPVEPEST